MKLALVLVLGIVGCGSHPGTVIDGGAGDDSGGDGSGSNLIDAAIDAPNVKGTVHVQVTNAATALCSTGGGTANLFVLFKDTDGTVTQVTTDASGNAQGDVFPGASVTAMCHRSLGVCAPAGSNCSYTMVTVLDVEPGDHLVLNADAFLTGHQPANTTAAGNFTVSYPAYATAKGYDVYHPCGKTPVSPMTATQQQLALKVGCLTTPMKLLVIANDMGGNPIAYTETTATFTSGGTATVTDTWHALATVTATYTNPGTKVGNIQLDRFVSDLPVVAGGALRSTATMNPAGGTVTLSVTSPLASQAMMRTILSPCAINAPNCSATGSQLITQALDSSPSYALDIAAKTLPWLGTTIYDPTTTILTVPATGTGPIDIFEADLAYTRNNTVLHVWRVFGPNIMDIHFANLLALPGGESPIPCPGTPCTDVQGVHHARIGDSDAIGGYRPARQNVFDSLETCEQPEGSPTPPPGTPVRRYGGTVNRFMQSQ